MRQAFRPRDTRSPASRAAARAPWSAARRPLQDHREVRDDSYAAPDPGAGIVPNRAGCRKDLLGGRKARKMKALPAGGHLCRSRRGFTLSHLVAVLDNFVDACLAHCFGEVRVATEALLTFTAFWES